MLVAARNEETLLPRCLDALAKQDYPPDKFEVIVIDDASTDHTASIAAEYATRHPFIRPLSTRPATGNLSPKKNALATGIAASNGEIIITTDADCVPPPGWVANLARQFEPGIDAIVGYSPLTLNERKSFWSAIIARLVQFDAFVNAVVSAGSIGLGKPSTAVGRNFAYQRSAFASVSGFGASGASTSGDDDLLLQRIAVSGGKVIFSSNPATFVPASGQSTLRDWLRMKRRHLSAGSHYYPGFILLSTALYLFNLSLVILTILACAGFAGWRVSLIVWGIKILADGLALARGARLLSERRWVFPWLVGELVSPLLFSLLVPLSLVGSIIWKNRRLKTAHFVN